MTLVSDALADRRISIEIHPVERMLLVTVSVPFSALYSFERIQMGLTDVSRFEYFTTLRETEL